MAARMIPPDENVALKRRRIPWLLIAFALPFAIQGIAFLMRLGHLVVLQGDTTYPEGAIIYAFMTSLRTGMLYSDPYHFPFNEQIYGPIFYIVGFASASLAQGNAVLTTELMRLISLFSFLGSVGLIARLTWTLEHNRLLTFVCVLTSLGCAWAIPFTASARPDALAILFFLGSLTIYQAACGRVKLLFAAGVLGALAGFTKQTMAVAVFAVILDSLIGRRWKGVNAYVGGALSVTALLFCILWFRHEPFLQNFAIAGHSIVNLSIILPSILLMLKGDELSIVAIGVSMIGVACCWRRERYRAILLVSALGVASNVLAIANTGSSNNYLILPWLLLMLFLPAGLLCLERQVRDSHAVPLCLAVACFFLLAHQRNLLREEIHEKLDCSGLADLEVLSDRPYLEMRTLNPEFLDPFFYHQLSLQHLWSIDPVLLRIKNETFDMITIHGRSVRAGSSFEIDNTNGMSLWGPEIVDAINRHYRQLCSVPEEMIFIPVGRSSRIQQTEMQAVFNESCTASMGKLQLANGTR